MPARIDWPATTLGMMNRAAKIAEPQPPKTSQNVPSASAAKRWGSAGEMCIRDSYRGGGDQGENVDLGHMRGVDRIVAAVIWLADIQSAVVEVQPSHTILKRLADYPIVGAALVAAG